MNVLLASWNFPPRMGGAEAFALGLAQALARRHDIRVLVGRPAAAPAEPRLRLAMPGREGFAAFCTWLPWALRRAARRERPDVVVAVNAAVGALCHVPWVPAGLPLATATLGTDLVHGGRLYRAFVRRGLRRARMVTAISRRTAELAVAAGAHPDRLVVIPPGLDPHLADRPWSVPARAPRAPVLLFVGRVVPRKGLLPFVERCLPEILHRRPVELWVVGDDPTDSLAHTTGELERVRTRVAATGLEESVRIFGQVPDALLRGAYRQAALLVMPTLELAGDVEGFGLVVPEAGLFGVPAVGMRTGGVADAIVDGLTGTLVAPGDWSGLAREIVRLLDDDALRRRLGEAAGRRAREELCWPVVGERWTEALETLLP